MLRISRILCLVSIAALFFWTACGMIPPSLRKTTFEAYPTFEASAEKITIEHKWPSFTAFSSGNKIHSGTYKFEDPKTAETSEFEVDMRWEKVEGFKLRPSFSIGDFEIISPEKEKLKGLRLTITDPVDSSGYEVVGVIKIYREEVREEKEWVEKTYYSFPCGFEIFKQGQEFGHVTVNAGKFKGLSVRRLFEFDINGQQFALQMQASTKIYYSLTTEEGLVGFMEVKGLSRVNTIGGEILLKPDLDDQLRSDILISFLIADLFNQAGI